RVLREVGQAEVANLVFRIDQVFPSAAGKVHPTLDARNLDDVAADRIVLHARIGALDGQGDHRALDAGDLFHGLVERDALGVLAVDMGDRIAGLNASLVSRAVSEGADNLQAAVLVALNLDADAAELALRRLVEFFQIARPDHAGERI